MSEPRTILTTPRLRLRTFAEADREPFARMNADPRVMEFFPAPLSRAESDAAVDRMQAHQKEHGYSPWALETGGEFGGFVGLVNMPFVTHFSPAVELGYRLRADLWNQGYATEAGKAVLEYAFGALGLTRIVSFTYEGNGPSRRVMEKLGLEYSGAFAHPWLAADHWLRKHVVYQLDAERFGA